MIEVEHQITDRTNTDTLVRIVEQVCLSHGLIYTLKGTLASYPGCVHWHFKKDNQKGILEITWWKKENRLWFKVADNRTGEWIEDSIPVLKEQIEKSLG
jgi:hypothetical protein